MSSNLLNQTLNTTSATVGNLVNGVTSAGSTVASGLSSNLSNGGVANQIVSTVGSTVGTAGSTVSNTAGAAGSTVSNTVGAIGSTASNTVGTVGSIVNGVTSTTGTVTIGGGSTSNTTSDQSAGGSLVSVSLNPSSAGRSSSGSSSSTGSTGSSSGGTDSGSTGSTTGSTGSTSGNGTGSTTSSASTTVGVTSNDTGTAISVDVPSTTIDGGHNQYVVIGNADGTLTVTPTTDTSAAITVPTGDVAVFTDGVGLADPTGALGDIARLYQATFGRAADFDGLEYWAGKVASGTSMTTVCADFVGSNEFQTTYGSVSNSGYVNLLYQNVLGRAADSSGISYWSQAMAGGTSRASVLESFANSTENKANTISTTDDPNYGTAYRLYQAAFNRTPDQSGLSYWASALDHGMTAAQVAASFTGTAEFQSDMSGATGSNLVGQLYQNVLGRAGETSGIDYWAGQLAKGQSEGSVLLGMANSAENVARTASATHAGWVFVSNS